MSLFLGRVLGFDSLSELQWAHQTLMRLIEIVQYNALVSDGQRECIVEMSRCAIMIERLILDAMPEFRRRLNDRER